MSSTYKGEKLTITIFGESHSEEIGVEIKGLPKGAKIDEEKLQSFLDRRKPGTSEFTTPRKEPDKAEFTEGLEKGLVSGDIRAIIRNTNKRSSDYDNLKDVPRPGHADFSAKMKYGMDFDMRGGGQFSGRLTAPLCIAGAIAIQLLEEKGIRIHSHIKSVGPIEDDGFDSLMEDAGKLDVNKKAFPVINDEKGELMKSEIRAAKENNDSVGGSVECIITGMPAGIGEPMFDGIENNIAKLAFAIPAMKGIEFGSGFEGSKRRGSDNNDAFYTDGEKVKTKSNNQGGILGGITNGMPIVFRCAFKPTPSIEKEQDSVNLKTKENVKVVVKGRHDPCIVIRALPCVEAIAALALYEYLI
ncbi:MAG: chorismate synthase [Lachnospiraceae bacterium]|nr:chorismate synthase [Lachnospiraceae bacterium]